MKKVTTTWTEVAMAFSRSVDSKILCPQCASSNLKAEDLCVEVAPAVIERKNFCEKCGAVNYLRLRKK